MGQLWLEAFIGDSGDSGGKSLGLEPSDWPDSGSFGAVSGSEAGAGANVSTSGSPSMF